MKKPRHWRGDLSAHYHNGWHPCHHPMISTDGTKSELHPVPQGGRKSVHKYQRSPWLPPPASCGLAPSIRDECAYAVSEREPNR